MPDTCTICDTIRPQGGTRHLVLNQGKMWLEFCETCGKQTKLKNEDTNEELTVAELYEQSKQEEETEEHEDDQFRG